MLTFALDEDNDLYTDSTGNIALSDGIEAISQTSKNFAATKRNEMIHSMKAGVPFFATSFDRFPSLAQFEAALRRRLLTVDGVERIITLNVQYVDEVINYTATLFTTEGVVTING